MLKADYRTKQQEMILRYIEKLQGTHITAKEIEEHLSKAGEKVGIATIYRRLDKMVAQGLVKKYYLDSMTAACYEYVPAEKECHEHFHLKCEKCGKLIHFECDTFAKMQEHLAKEHGFAVNSLKTVLYGLCNECNNKSGSKK